MDRRAYATAAAAVVVVGAAALVVSPSTVMERVDRLAEKPVYFALALVGLALVRPFLAWPTTLLPVAAGYGFEWWGLPFGLALMVTTSLPPFLFADRLEGGRFAEVGEEFIKATGDLRGLVFARFFPAPSDIVSVEAGLTGLSLRTYVLGTAIGETPWATVGVLAGLSLESLAEGGLSASAFDPRLVVAVALLGLLVVAEPAYEHFTGDGDDGDDGTLIERLG